MPDQPNHIILFKDGNFHGGHEHIFDQEPHLNLVETDARCFYAAACVKQNLQAIGRPTPHDRFWRDLELPTSATHNPRCSSRSQTHYRFRSGDVDIAIAIATTTRTAPVTGLDEINGDLLDADFWPGWCSLFQLLDSPLSIPNPIRRKTA